MLKRGVHHSDMQNSYGVVRPFGTPSSPKGRSGLGHRSRINLLLGPGITSNNPSETGDDGRAYHPGFLGSGADFMSVSSTPPVQTSGPALSPGQEYQQREGTPKYQSQT